MLVVLLKGSIGGILLASVCLFQLFVHTEGAGMQGREELGVLQKLSEAD